MSVSTGRRRAPGRSLLVFVLGLALAACDADLALVATTGAGGARLQSGAYLYRAWSERSRRGPAWSGSMVLRVRPDGTITGSYRFPGQCPDRFGHAADCVGRVDGRLFHDGSFVLALDDGWLRNEGIVRRASEATGYWDLRLLGFRDFGSFEMLRR